jgi:hypothetical protein
MPTATACTMADYVKGNCERLDFDSPVIAYKSAKKIRENLKNEGLENKFNVSASNTVVRIKLVSV